MSEKTGLSEKDLNKGFVKLLNLLAQIPLEPIACLYFLHKEGLLTEKVFHKESAKEYNECIEKGLENLTLLSEEEAADLYFKVWKWYGDEGIKISHQLRDKMITILNNQPKFILH